ncbi:hypothetical protein BJP36_27145 [Moorena producens JHB]|uniref:Phytanoyl-CoA dioxygenase n=1 Tax=Moorena producens (strain JHB) TaxID=1454205 RepID=A0A1D9G604_MOOP1|nr:hypothetical protein [Moorena producens]AOY83046.1 hypothetical protein BJP36_27145 [Moorena producens JHB]
MSSLVNKITLSQTDKEFFWENGFIKLNRLLTWEATDKLRELTYNSKQITKAPEYYTGDFSRIGYGVENAVTHQIYSEENFKYTLKQLIENELTFIESVGFELKPNKRGFYFHLDVASFSFIKAEDLAYSLWIPLVPINTKYQHGGMAYVPQNVYPASGYFYLIYELVKHENIAEFCKTEDFKFFNFPHASKVEELILEKNKVEDDFEVGDALLLNKFVWHRSAPLRLGKLPSRMAYTMRFVDSQARYAKKFLDDFNYMVKAMGDDPLTSFGYKLTDLKEGDLISKSKFVDRYNLF